MLLKHTHQLQFDMSLAILNQYRESLCTTGKIPSTLIPEEVEIELLFTCNLKCPMCQKWEVVPLKKEPGTKLTTERVLSLIGELKQMNIQQVTFSGGEPTLRSDFSKIVAKVNEAGLKGRVITNGTLIKEPLLKEMAASGWDIAVSIDGSKPEIHDVIRGVPGCFNLTMKNVKTIEQLWKQSSGQFSVLCVLQRENIPLLQEFCTFAESLAATNVSIELVAAGTEKKRITKEDFTKLKQLCTSGKLFGKVANTNDLFVDAVMNNSFNPVEVEQGAPSKSLFSSTNVTCFACATQSYISAYGDVFACCYGFNNPDVKPLGNILTQPFKEIWYSDTYNSFRCSTLTVNLEKHPFNSLCDSCEKFFDFRDTERRLDSISKKVHSIDHLSASPTSRIEIPVSIVAQNPSLIEKIKTDRIATIIKIPDDLQLSETINQLVKLQCPLKYELSITDSILKNRTELARTIISLPLGELSVSIDTKDPELLATWIHETIQAHHNSVPAFLHPHNWKILSQFSTPSNTPATLFVNSSCNNNCKSCIYNIKSRPSPSFYYLKQCIQKASKVHNPSLIIKGGEATMRDDLPDIISYARKQGFHHIALETNGRLFSYQNVCTALANQLDSIIIYVFGNEAEHDSFTQVPGSYQQSLNGYNNLKHSGTNVELKIHLLTNLLK